MVGLSHKMNSLPDELSGGEQQRVSIARAFVNHPPLLVCDEPTGNLDPDTSVGIMQLLYRINRAGHDDPDGHPRPRDGRQDAQARDPARGRPARPRRAARGVHGRMRLRLLVSEAWREPRREHLDDVRRDDDRARRHVPARALHRARHAGRVSWSNHVKRELVVKVDFKTNADKGGPATRAQENAVARKLAGEPAASKHWNVHLEGEGARSR